MSSRDRWIARHLRRLRAAQFVRHASEWLAVYLCLFGTAVLAVRLLAPGLWPDVLWLGVGVVPVTVLAWWRTGRDWFTRGESVALLDRSLGAGGLLMALTEVSHAEWESRLPQVERRWQESLPRWRGQRLLMAVGLPVAFACGACFVPLREIGARPVTPTTAGEQAAARLAELLNVLEETASLDTGEEQALRESIGQLQRETEQSPLTHEKWETVDSLERRMRLHLQAASDQVTQGASAAQLLASSAAAGAESLDGERVQQLEQHVLDALESLAGREAQPGRAASLRQSLQGSRSGGRSGSNRSAGEARAELLSELESFLEQESARLNELREAYAVTCSRCGQSDCPGGECESGTCASCGGACDGGVCADCEGAGVVPGRGGVTRGRGDAAMSWGDESDPAGVRFRETVLPPGMLDEVRDEVEGITRVAPEVEVAEPSPRSESGSRAPTAGRETWDRTLRPRHRDVVRKYFDRVSLSDDRPDGSARTPAGSSSDEEK